MQGTGSVKVVSPVKLGTSVLTCVHTKLFVVAAQRSGGPKSSTRASLVSAS